MNPPSTLPARRWFPVAPKLRVPKLRAARVRAGGLRAGRVRLAFAVLLLLAIGLGGPPVLRHTLDYYRLHRRIGRLVSGPLGAELAALPARIAAFEAQAAEVHRVLALAEDELWYYQSRREPALILKDFAGVGGTIGLTGLVNGYQGVAEGGAILRARLGADQLAWRYLRENPREEEYLALAAVLRVLPDAAAGYGVKLRRYASQLAGVAARSGELRPLLPQLSATPPPALRDLPERLSRLQTRLRSLMAALTKGVAGASRAVRDGG